MTGSGHDSPVRGRECNGDDRPRWRPVLVGFSEWPIRAERSLDITFDPQGGIEGKSAAIRITDPQGSGTGILSAIPVGERPGPPPAPMWLAAALPRFFLPWLGVRGWRQVRPGQSPEARSWA